MPLKKQTKSKSRKVAKSLKTSKKTPPKEAPKAKKAPSLAPKPKSHSSVAVAMGKEVKKPKIKSLGRFGIAFDTETTGLIENVTMKDKRLPEVIEFYGCLFDIDTGEVKDEIDTLIAPTLIKKLPPEIIKATNITDDMLKGKKPFAFHAKQIASFFEKAPRAFAHNASFDKEILGIEFSRAGVECKWPFVICTIEQTMHIKGYRMNLSDLHLYLFNEGFADAHRAKNDVLAMVRCIVELVKRGELI